MENILLTEANYKDKYPPLGLMKISTYHKLKGDIVEYTREFRKKKRNFYSKIYISTRFSFHWKKTSELIRYYQKNFDAEILIGGIHASINPKLYEKEFGLKPNVGSLHGDIDSISNKIKDDEILLSFLDDIEKYGIDVLPPDYSLFDHQDLPFIATLQSNYLLRSTKGCTRNCNFCDVKKICEGYIDKLPLLPIIKYIDKNFGTKANILFFDDNTLMSKKFNDIIIELKEAGFNKGVRFNRRLRSCDFNQGMDLRLLDDRKIDLLNTICISPLRFAFDDINMKDIYTEKIKKVIRNGLKNISVYVLFNYNDTPQDFYERLRISAILNKKYNCRIFSFPMKFVPNELTDRKYIGKHWTKRMIRGVQSILNSSHGIVPVSLSFFERAFGKNYDEFFQIINMPEKYIMHRNDHKLQIEKWKTDFASFNEAERKQVLRTIEIPIIDFSLNKLTVHYINEKY
jgi:hypothetical protein